MLLIGISACLLSRSYRHTGSRLVLTEVQEIFPAMVAVQSTFISIAVSYIPEDTPGEIALTDVMPALCVNLFSSAIAIMLGGCTFFRINLCATDLAIDTRDMLSNALFVGLTALGSFGTWSPAYSSPLQIGAYLFAAMFVLDSNDTGMQRTATRIQCDYSWGRSFTCSEREGQEENDGYTSIGHGPDSRLQQQRISDMRTIKLSEVVATGISATIWMCFIATNFFKTTRQAPYRVPSLDTNYTSSSQLDIVVSMYNEAPESVINMMAQLDRIPIIASRNPRLLVYSKDESVNVTSLQTETGATRVIHLANYGREGETYLYHILNNWDDLAKHTIFLQAGIHNPRELYPRIRDYFTPQTGMLSLGFSGNTCHCNSCGDRWGWSDQSGIISRTYEQVHHDSCAESTRILLSYKGQFIASAPRIRGVHHAVYETLHTALVDEKSWAHQEPYLADRPDSLNAPLLGYTLERLWSTLFQCSDLDVALRCPTLLSGTRRWGSPADCQCFD